MALASETDRRRRLVRLVFEEYMALPPDVAAAVLEDDEFLGWLAESGPILHLDRIIEGGALKLSAGMVDRVLGAMGGSDDDATG